VGGGGRGHERGASTCLVGHKHMVAFDEEGKENIEAKKASTIEVEKMGRGKEK
jgi:hypothetical protein